jgi:hypothetical protein
MASKLSSTQLSDYYYNKIANELNLTINQVKNTAQLLKVNQIQVTIVDRPKNCLNSFRKKIQCILLPDTEKK